ncbi:MAG: NADH-quinone oxidoreductase subunit L [Myxococcales bacterium]|nr:NADH-quinone oxidoreductase subunit L [Myxococcales bacterium]
MSNTALLSSIVLLPLLGALINGLFAGRLPRRVVEVIACSTVIVSFLFSLKAFLQLMALPVGAREIHAHLYNWVAVGNFRFDVAFYLDPLSSMMSLIITGVGGLIHVYSAGYMSHDPSYGRYFSYLNLFTFSMLSLVLGNNILLMFLGWEGVGLCSYLLIGFWFTDVQKAKAGKKAFIVNRIGDLAFIVGVGLLLGLADGNLDFTYLRKVTALRTLYLDPMMVKGICLAFFIGATGKSAQIPLYVWLPDAMAGPTPVSALIHAATMVTAGIYMIARLNFMYALAPEVLTLIAGVGAATALFAATIGIVQRDIKKVLAYSTVSQLGYMFLAVGMGAYTAAMFHLMTHAFFKACLFLGSGSVIHSLHGEQDIIKMGGLRKKMPVTALTFLTATMAISGVPLFAGFFSKDEILWKAFTNAHAGMTTVYWGKIFFVVGLIAALCTAFYMFRLYFLTFEGEYRGPKETEKTIHESPVSMTLALVVLAFLSVVGGYVQIGFAHVHLLEDWLAPVFAVGSLNVVETMGHSWEYATMAMSVAIAGVGIGAAYYLYMGAGTKIPARMMEAAPRLYNFVWNKYKIDELYQVVFVGTYRSFAHFSHRFADAFVIDFLGVRGTGALAQGIGRVIGRLQNGDVQRYLVVFVVGLTLILYLWLQ